MRGAWLGLVALAAGCDGQPLYVVDLYTDEDNVSVGRAVELRADATVNGLAGGTAYLSVFSVDTEGSTALPELDFDFREAEPADRTTYTDPPAGDPSVSDEVALEVADDIEDLTATWNVGCYTRGKWELRGTMRLVDADGEAVVGPGESNDVTAILNCQ